MPIPVGTYYQKKELGNGTVATIENNVVDTVTAGEEINFGVAVNIKDGKAVTATSAPIMGIAIKRNRIDGDDYNALPDDKFKAGLVYCVKAVSQFQLLLMFLAMISRL